jgi:glycosyltransferase involved in cell wall biosynthesis
VRGVSRGGGAEAFGRARADRPGRAPKVDPLALQPFVRAEGGARPFVIVAGDFVTTGGMDAANHALAAGLAARGRRVHLVTHRAADDLARLTGVTVHAVPRPLGSHLLGFPLLDRAGRRIVHRLEDERPHVIANGGNCRAGDVVWLHYVHAAAPLSAGRGALRRAAGALLRRRFIAAERRAVCSARLVIANSQATRRHAVELLGAPIDRVRTIYYGMDPQRFRPPTPRERTDARAALGWTDDRPAVAFVGALGDRRKGFDTLFDAWTRLCRDGSFDARLAVVGTGAELPAWRERASVAGLSDRIEFLGFQADVRRVLWACDALAAPTRYEAYGLAVHEALCCGLPAFVSARAGVAERMPTTLSDLLIANPDDPRELGDALRRWCTGRAAYADSALAASDELRSRTWDDMAAEVLDAVEAAR